MKDRRRPMLDPDLLDWAIAAALVAFVLVLLRLMRWIP